MSESRTNYKFRVAVVGCGISGLSLAAFISKFNAKDPGSRIAVDIYEAKLVISTLGAGIGIWKRTWQALQDLDGFAEDVLANGFKVPVVGQSQGPVFRKSDQPTEGYDFHNHIMPYGPLGLHRPTLIEILQSKLSSDCQIQTSKKLAGYAVLQDGSVQLTFTDGSTATADVLVGADGVHSAARGAMFKSLGDGYKQFIQPIFSGTMSYRGSIPKGPFAKTFPAHSALDHPKSYCGKNMHAISHPLGPSITMNFLVALPGMGGKPYLGPMVSEVPNERVVRLFADWEPDVRSLAENVESYIAWAVHVVNPLPLCASGPAVLIGDAAHAMTPHQGVGGGQAIEDAHMLARLLAHSSAIKANISAVLKLFQGLRLAPAQDAAEKSRLNGLMYEFNHPDSLFDVPSHEELAALGEAIGLTFEWLAEGNAKEDWAEAERQLKML